MQKTGIFCLLVFWACLSLQAQVNIKVGYNAQYTFFKTTNRLFDQYNNQTPNLTSKYKPFHFMHGLDLGLRYMMGNHISLEAGFTNLFTGDHSSSTTVNGTVSQDEWRISHRCISLGVENYYGWFGYGVHVGHSKWKYLKDFAGASSKQAVYNQDHYTLRFNLIFQAVSGNNAFALKPYYYYPLSNKNIAVVGETLNGTSSLSVENFESFGVSIVFYNGPQR